MLGPEYRKLWTASTISKLRDGVTVVAALLLAAALTHDPALVVGLALAVIRERLFGWVNSVYRLVSWGGISLGAWLGGFLVRNFGLTAPFWVAAVVPTVMTLVALPVVNNRTLAEARGECPESTQP
jgi:predicted MFS family arabinose efflux permease